MANRTLRLGSVNVLERSLIAVTVILVTLGVLFVGSAAAPQYIASGGSAWVFIGRDLIMVALGAVGFVVACRFPAAKMARLATPALLISGALLVVVEVVGTTTSGGRRWLTFGGLSLQPSELFTLATCFYLAFVVARVERSSRHWIEVVRWTIPVMAGAVLIFLEPDMGTGSIILIVTLGMLWLAGLPNRLLGATVALGLTGGFVYAMSAPYRRARLLALFDPSAHANGAGYQVLQAKIGLGAGRLTGLGFGQSREKWGLLPNPHTDFIFAIVGEEFGFIGAVVLIGLFVWLIALGARTARRAPNRESQLLAAGITLWFGVETFINVASVVGWWPVTGIPLPFVSYGGTSLIINLTALGLLVNVARRTTCAPSSRRAATLVSPVRPRHLPLMPNAFARGVSMNTLARERRRSH